MRSSPEQSNDEARNMLLRLLRGRPPALARARLRHLSVACLLLGALVLRFAYLHGPPPPVFGDANAYDAAGRRLAAGQATPETWSTMASRGPVYPLFLAAVFYVSGEDPAHVRLVQAVLGALVCLFAYGVGRRVAGRTAGLIAGLLAAVCPALVLQTSRLLTEPLSTFLLWAGVRVLFTDLRTRSGVQLLVAGCLVSLACLTRPTLLPIAPFLILGAAVAPPGDRRRLGMLALFGLAVLAPIAWWGLYIRSRLPTATVGTAGLGLMANVASAATDPRFRGWLPDLSAPEWTPWVIDEWWKVGAVPDSAYLAAAPVSLVFHHLWYSDNVWRETFVLSPAAMDAVQRVVFLLGLGGLGVALSRWRVYAPLLALALGFPAMTLRWIEIRPAAPLLPAVCVLGGVFLAALGSPAAAGTGGSRRRLLWWTASGALAAVSRFPVLTTLLSGVHPMVVGRLSDAMTVGVALLFGAAASNHLKARLGRGSALVAGFVPALLFAGSYASYAHVGSAPRWLGWSIPVPDAGGFVVHELHLASPLVSEEMDSAHWLVDLTSEANPPPCIVAVNGTWVLPGQYYWQPSEPGVRTRLPYGLTVAYETLTRFAGGVMSDWPQWWTVAFDPALLDGRKVVSLALSRSTTASSTRSGRSVRIGGVFSDESRGDVYGPSLRAEMTSIYRWEVHEDWRMWETTPLGSLHTASYVRPRSQLASEAVPPYVESMLDRGHARLNIRLVVRYKDGRTAVY